MSKQSSSRTSTPRRRSGKQDRTLLIALSIVFGVGLILVGGFIYFGAPDSRSTATETNPPIASSQTVNAPPPARVPPSSIESDQRITATRRAPVEDSAASTGVPGADATGDRATTVTDSDAASGQPTAATNDPAEDESNPRKLLRTARRQIKAGESLKALSTSRKIASLVENAEKRSRIEAKIDDAEGAAGKGQTVDFDSLIELIESTISPNSWSSVGGAGTVESFPGGVYVDTGGLVKPRGKASSSAELNDVREENRPAATPGDANGQPGLRKISLPRLEKEVASRLAKGEPLGEDLRYLAGLMEVRYVLVYPEEHDVVVVGPAEEWRTDEFGRAVGRQSGRPVMQLEDLAVILRACYSDSQNHGLFGCGIYPRAERLQQVQEFLNRSAAAGPIDPSQRNRWLGELRDQLGPQDIDVFGIHPGSRVAHVLVEADYRMKLIGIGLEQAAAPGIPSYFDLLGQPDDARLNRPLDTLRWWFMLNYESILTSDERDAFELRGGRVQVLSENELLTVTGQRVHTGQSDPINAQFAKNFTDQFRALADRDVNFADLAGIFDLAVVAGLLRGHEIPKAIGWEMSTLLDPDEYIVSLNPAPRTVETVINHRVYRGRHIMAAISGGVHVNPWKVVSEDRLQADTAGSLKQLRSGSQSPREKDVRWWWD
jgi:hypothetical protein